MAIAPEQPAAVATPPGATLDGPPGVLPVLPALGWRRHLLIILLFMFLTCLATWPLATRPHNILIGTPGDSLYWPWNFAWARQALVVEHRSPFFCDAIFRPFSVAILHHTHTLFYGLLYCLGGSLYENPFFWANLFTLGSFVLAGYGTFLLARRLTGHTAGALLAGAIYAFCSLRMERVGAHLNILSSELIPWYLYFLFRGAGENRARWFLAAALCFAATTWNEYYNSLFLILFSLLFLVLMPFWKLHYGHPWRSRLRTVLPGVGLAAVLLAPFAWGLWRTVATQQVIAAKGVDQYYVTLLNYLIPAGDHRLLGRWLGPFYEGLPGNAGEATVFFGYVALFLAIYSLVAIRGKSREQKFMLAGLLFFFVMSLGTTMKLRLLGRAWELQLPYAWFIQLPFFSDFRVPARFGGMVALCAAVLGAYGYRAAVAGIASRRRLAALTGFLIALVLLENLFAPYPHHFNPFDPRAVPHWLLSKIKADPVPGAVLNIPPSHADWTALWLQTLHHKPIVTGNLARLADSQVAYYDNLDLRGWFYQDPRHPWPDSPAQWTRENVSRFCYFFDLRHILIPPTRFETDLAGQVRTDLLPLQTGVREGRAWLGALEKQGPRWPLVIDAGSTADNYYFTANFTRPAGGSRWLADLAGQVAFRLDTPRDLTLRVGLGYPVHLPPGVQRLRIRVGGRLLSEQPVAPAWSEQRCRIPRELTRAGINFITFEPARCPSPAEMGFNQDPRKLAVMFSRITLQDVPKE